MPQRAIKQPADGSESKPPSGWRARHHRGETPLWPGKAMSTAERRETKRSQTLPKKYRRARQYTLYQSAGTRSPASRRFRGDAAAVPGHVRRIRSSTVGTAAKGRYRKCVFHCSPTTHTNISWGRQDPAKGASKTIQNRMPRGRKQTHSK